MRFHSSLFLGVLLGATSAVSAEPAVTPTAEQGSERRAELKRFLDQHSALEMDDRKAVSLALQQHGEQERMGQDPGATLRLEGRDWALQRVATAVGDRDSRDSDVNRIMKRLETRPITVHVVVFNNGSATSGGGTTQTNVSLILLGKNHRDIV